MSIGSPARAEAAIARRLIREEGLLVGGSAGTNVAAALRIGTGLGAAGWTVHLDAAGDAA